jgi:hypothetical protein
MLLAFVLLGRTLEARARLRASGAQHALRGALRRGACGGNVGSRSCNSAQRMRVGFLRGGHVPHSQSPQDMTHIMFA